MTDESAGIDDGEINTAPHKSGTDYESLKQWVFSVLGESKESFLVFTSYEVLFPGFLAHIKEHKDRSERASKLKFKKTGDGENIVFNIPNRFKR